MRRVTSRSPLGSIETSSVVSRLPSGRTTETWSPQRSASIAQGPLPVATKEPSARTWRSAMKHARDQDAVLVSTVTFELEVPQNDVPPEVELTWRGVRHACGVESSNRAKTIDRFAEDA